mmetsp:Transcript_144/g.359  ORF Transcript_144/g.359 Transcript_144/m.359 type:complete len:345 (+) Transcript_144:2445-3479(+)
MVPDETALLYTLEDLYRFLLFPVEDERLGQSKLCQCVLRVGTGGLLVQGPGLFRLPPRMKEPGHLIQRLGLAAAALREAVGPPRQDVHLVVRALVEGDEGEQVQHHRVRGVEIVGPLQQLYRPGHRPLLGLFVVDKDGGQARHRLDVEAVQIQRPLEGLAGAVVPLEAEEAETDADPHGRRARLRVDPQGPLVPPQGRLVLPLVELGAGEPEDRGYEVGVVVLHHVEDLLGLADVVLDEEQQATADDRSRVDIFPQPARGVDEPYGGLLVLLDALPQLPLLPVLPPLHGTEVADPGLDLLDLVGGEGGHDLPLVLLELPDLPVLLVHGPVALVDAVPVGLVCLL